MIDFPASPTDGQIFSAPNGVVYKWSATYSSWLAQNPAPPLGGTGQVTATGGSTPAINTNTDVVLQFSTVTNGNAGLWWNTATNRFTPPAGSYFLQANLQFAVDASNTVSCALRKNGTRLFGYISGTGIASASSVPITIGEYVDANGTDYFDWVANGSSGVGSTRSLFSAFPLTGLQGPTGPVGLQSGAGPPTGLSATKGTLYTNTTATTTTTRLYINTDGGTTWANFTASA